MTLIPPVRRGSGHTKLRHGGIAAFLDFRTDCVAPETSPSLYSATASLPGPTLRQYSLKSHESPDGRTPSPVAG